MFWRFVVVVVVRNHVLISPAVFMYHAPLRVGRAPLKKYESPLSEDLLSQIWLILTERAWTTSISLYYFPFEQAWLKKEYSVLPKMLYAKFG